MQFLYLSRADVAAIDVPMAEIIELVETAFAEKGAGRTEMPPKPGIHPGEDCFIHAMPAWIPALRSAGIKWVSGFPPNIAKGLPYISGLLILNDADTGFPVAAMDCTWITGKRTGAASAVSAMYLGGPGAETIGILACGVQGRSHLEAMKVVQPGIWRAHAYDIDRARAEAFAAEMGPKLGVEVHVVDDPEAAVREMDIVVTSGPILKHPQPAIEAGWVKPGVFASAVDYDSYWQPGALAEFDKFTTDDAAQFRYYQEAGYFQHTPALHADLGEIVAGLRPGRKSPEERNMAMNLGLAIDDMAVAPKVYEKAKEMGVGVWLEL
jgi:ornithine cyclodeaminase/alanine dehydrogenase-like protein (mu-crystallin family)